MGFVHRHCYACQMSFQLKFRIISRLTKGGSKNKGPAFSAGQWPSLACKAKKEICSPSHCCCGCLICNFFTIPNLHLWYCLFEILLSQKLQGFFFGQMKRELVKKKFKRKEKKRYINLNSKHLPS